MNTCVKHQDQLTHVHRIALQSYSLFPSLVSSHTYTGSLCSHIRFSHPSSADTRTQDRSAVIFAFPIPRQLTHVHRIVLQSYSLFPSLVSSHTYTGSLCSHIRFSHPSSADTRTQDRSAVIFAFPIPRQLTHVHRIALQSYSLFPSLVS